MFRVFNVGFSDRASNAIAVNSIRVLKFWEFTIHFLRISVWKVSITVWGEKWVGHIICPSEKLLQLFTCIDRNYICKMAARTKLSLSSRGLSKIRLFRVIPDQESF